MHFCFYFLTLTFAISISFFSFQCACTTTTATDISYINNKSTKYLLRCGSKDQAMETHGMFTKHDGDPMHNLKEMQVLWVATEYGFSALRAQEYGPALKKFLQVSVK